MIRLWAPQQKFRGSRAPGLQGSRDPPPPPPPPLWDPISSILIAKLGSIYEGLVTCQVRYQYCLEFYLFIPRRLSDPNVLLKPRRPEGLAETKLSAIFESKICQAFVFLPSHRAPRPCFPALLGLLSVYFLSDFALLLKKIWCLSPWQSLLSFTVLETGSKYAF